MTAKAHRWLRKIAAGQTLNAITRDEDIHFNDLRIAVTKDPKAYRKAREAGKAARQAQRYRKAMKMARMRRRNMPFREIAKTLGKSLGQASSIYRQAVQENPRSELAKLDKAQYSATRHSDEQVRKMWILREKHRRTYREIGEPHGLNAGQTWSLIKNRMRARPEVFLKKHLR